MKLSNLSLIKSERGLRSVLSSLFFGAKGALLSTSANFEQVTRTVSNLRNAGYDDRALAIQESRRFITLEEAVTAAATKAASIQTFADCHGVVLEVDFAPDLARGKDMKQMEAASIASGVDIKVIQRKEQEAIKRKFDQQTQAQSMAEQMFWSAPYNEEVDVKTETVANALTRQRDYMLEWSVLDLGELTILRHDIEVITALIDMPEYDDNHIDKELPITVSASSMYALQQQMQQRDDSDEDEDEEVEVEVVKPKARRVKKVTPAEQLLTHLVSTGKISEAEVISKLNAA